MKHMPAMITEAFMKYAPLPLQLGVAASRPQPHAIQTHRKYLLECRTIARPTALIQSSFSCERRMAQCGRPQRLCTLHNLPGQKFLTNVPCLYRTQRTCCRLASISQRRGVYSRHPQRPLLISSGSPAEGSVYQPQRGCTRHKRLADWR